MVRNRQSQDTYRALSLRMIRETEEFLVQSLQQPGHGMRIPAAEVSQARFDPRLASVFWSQALGVPYDPPPEQALILAQRIGQRLDPDL